MSVAIQFLIILGPKNFCDCTELAYCTATKNVKQNGWNKNMRCQDRICSTTKCYDTYEPGCIPYKLQVKCEPKNNCFALKNALQWLRAFLVWGTKVAGILPIVRQFQSHCKLSQRNMLISRGFQVINCL